MKSWMVTVLIAAVLSIVIASFMALGGMASDHGEMNDSVDRVCATLKQADPNVEC